ncbi:DinB family protein [Plantactinospora sp. WMMC1484]|uniref:DinB family protein n=1 Tax=Plantactinospora sp. WMMC1484 TaxID=3404122 RepID=UPI003BF567D8
MATTTSAQTVTGERADLLESLGHARHFLRFTARELSDEQATTRSTVSVLCVGGLIKHVTAGERQWTRFIVEGAASMPAGDDPATYAAHAAGFRMEPGETLAALLEEYENVARHTDELVRTLPDLDAGHELPPAPWFAPGARWSARRVLQHIIAETAQHAGHADIIRESIDGSRSMG